MEDILPLALLLWIAGSAWMGVRLARDLVALNRLRSRATPERLPPGQALSRPARLARSVEVSAPLLAGYRHPVILLPGRFRIDEAARPVLEHEIAHAVRGDAWTVLLQRLVMSVFWWALPLHALLPVIARSREMLCDREAARVTGQPDRLALALLDAAAHRAATASLALAAAPSRSDLARRVRYLASFDSSRKKDTAMRLALILPVLAAGTVLLTPHVGAAREPGDEAGPPALARSLDDARDIDAALFLAARRGRIARMNELLERGADPDVRFSGDGTPLIAAVRSGDIRGVELLLEAGADPDLGVSGDGNPVIAAASAGNRALVLLLIEAGADVNSFQSGDGNPLIAAALRGDLAMTELLLAAGADPDAYVPGDETPLIAAAQQGHLAVAQRLVEAGADVSRTVFAHHRGGEEVFRSPIGEARRNHHRDVVQWLESLGAEHRPPAG